MRNNGGEVSHLMSRKFVRKYSWDTIPTVVCVQTVKVFLCVDFSTKLPTLHTSHDLFFTGSTRTTACFKICSLTETSLGCVFVAEWLGLTNFQLNLEVLNWSRLSQLLTGSIPQKTSTERQRGSCAVEAPWWCVDTLQRSLMSNTQLGQK